MQSVRHFKHRYKKSRYTQIGVWLYIFAFFLFMAGIQWQHLEPVWNFTNEHAPAITASALALGLFFWLMIYSVFKANELDQKRGKMRFQYRLNTYRALEECVYPKDKSVAVAKLDSAIRDLQIFGEDSERRMAKQLANNFQTNNGYKYSDIIDVLMEMRKHLREDLGTEQVDYDEFFVIRTQKKAAAKKPVAKKKPAAAAKKAPAKKKAAPKKKSAK